MRPLSFLNSILVLSFVLASCAAPATATPAPASPEPTVRGVEPMYTNAASNGVITFTDSVSGISLDYPEGWIMDQVRGGTKSPSVFVFTNMFHIPSLMDKITDDVTVIYLTILIPSPEQSLNGMEESFKAQWQKEGSTIVSEQAVTIANGQAGVEIVLDSYIGRRNYFLLTQAGGKFLYFEGLGDLTPVKAIAFSVR